MRDIKDILTKELERAFSAAGYDAAYAAVSVSDRPDLCEYQCSGALRAARQYHKAPLVIAGDVAKRLEESGIICDAAAAAPGFLNFNVNGDFLAQYIADMARGGAERLGCEKTGRPLKIIMDYGGPNVAKPLHVGHLRSAVIGESLKRIARFMGHEVTADVHLGDWGLQMGLIIRELWERQPELSYFNESFTGEYPEDAPFTISDLEEIYPAASARSKEDAQYRAEAMAATHDLQSGRRGYRALFEKIIEVSVTDLKKNYERLGVSFDLWNGESDAQKYIPDMVQKMKDGGQAHISDGALVVDVARDDDKKKVPPCMILKSDGSALYNTTDLATLVMRMEDGTPDRVIYIVDKRQELYFEQVFRCARKCGIVPDSTELVFVGFGTMNGKDGKPFKTREGGVMRLEALISDAVSAMESKIRQSRADMSEADIEKTAREVAVAAIKYGDLSNQSSKDYIFDLERFTSSEGNTGPYILYTIVRIGSILKKAADAGIDIKNDAQVLPPDTPARRALMLGAARFTGTPAEAYAALAPHYICAYMYELANELNRFYHDTRIIAETDAARQASDIMILRIVKRILEICSELLGFESPERM